MKVKWFDEIRLTVFIKKCKKNLFIRNLIPIQRRLGSAVQLKSKGKIKWCCLEWGWNDNAWNQQPPFHWRVKASLICPLVCPVKSHKQKLFSSALWISVTSHFHQHCLFILSCWCSVLPLRITTSLLTTIKQPRMNSVQEEQGAEKRRVSRRESCFWMLSWKILRFK